MSGKRAESVAVLAIAMLGWSARPALADKAASLALFKQAKVEFRAEHYPEAIRLFERAYAEHPSPAYLYNIAQAHRKLGNCREAQRHYRWFLREKPRGSHRADVTKRIAALTAECGEVAIDPPAAEPAAENDGAKPAAAETEPQSEKGESHGKWVRPDPGDIVVPARATDADDSAETVSEESEQGEGRSSDAAEVGARATPVAPSPSSSTISAGVEAGIASFDMGEVVLPSAAATVLLSASYGRRLGPVDAEVGLAVELSMMEYEAGETVESANFASALLNVGASRRLAARFRVGAEVGAGLLRISGLSDGNPFTAGGVGAGALQSLTLRAGAFAELGLSRQFAVRLSSAFAYAGAHEELAADIDRVTRLEILGGIRYRR